MYASDGLRGKVGCLGKPLVPKMPGPRKHHRNAVLVAGLDALVIALGAAGLDDAGHAVRGKHVDVSRNGKNASLAQAKPPFSTPSRSQKSSARSQASSAESTRLG